VRINVRVGRAARGNLAEPTRNCPTHHHGQPEACMLEAGFSGLGHGRARVRNARCPTLGCREIWKSPPEQYGNAIGVGESRTANQCGLAAECGFDTCMNVHGLFQLTNVSDGYKCLNLEGKLF